MQYIRIKRDEENRHIIAMNLASSIENLKSNDQKNKKDIESEPPTENKKEIFIYNINNFINQIETIRSNLITSMQIIPFMSTAIFQTEIESILKKSAKIEDKSRDLYFEEIYKISRSQAKDVSESISNHRKISQFSEFTPKFFLIGLISIYDGFIGSMLKDIFESRKEILNISEKSVSFKDIFEFEKIEEIREFLIEKEVESILRESHESHFDWLERKLDVKLRVDLERWPEFIEICERRNLLTHASGKVSRFYLDKCKKTRSKNSR